MRVLFTGGSGKAGKHVVAYLAAQGHRVLNVDRVPLGHPDVADLIEQFHYQPATTVVEGIERFVVWYRDYLRVSL